jgi:hypothetical protein
MVLVEPAAPRRRQLLSHDLAKVHHLGYLPEKRQKVRYENEPGVPVADI